MDIINESLLSDESLLGAVVQVLDFEFGFSLLLLNLLLLVVANGFLGDLVEKAEDDGGEDEPE